MMEFAALYESTREDSSIYRMHFQRQCNIPWDSGKLIKHKVVQGTIQFEVPQLLCTDDTALVFANRDNTGVGVNLAFDIFASLVWEMHIGHDKKDLKAECIFFPPAWHFKPNFMSNVSTLTLAISANHQKESLARQEPSAIISHVTTVLKQTRLQYRAVSSPSLESSNIWDLRHHAIWKMILMFLRASLRIIDMLARCILFGDEIKLSCTESI